MVSPDEKAFDDAVNSGDWATAATSLAKLAMPRTKLPPLMIDQLRLLQDAVTRVGSVLGGAGSVLQLAISAELQGKGVPATKVAAGAAFGKLETKVDERIDGDKATGTWYAYKISIAFTPDTAVIDADEIAFIQTGPPRRHRERLQRASRREEQKTPDTVGHERGPAPRQKARLVRDDDGQRDGQRHADRLEEVRPGHAGQDAGPREWEPAQHHMAVRDHGGLPLGVDAGKVYAVVTWGFTVDADLKLTEQAPTMTNKQSTEATEAVRKWNNQTAGSAADRNALGQMSLPALK